MNTLFDFKVGAFDISGHEFWSDAFPVNHIGDRDGGDRNLALKNVIFEAIAATWNVLEERTCGAVGIYVEGAFAGPAVNYGIYDMVDVPGGSLGSASFDSASKPSGSGSKK